MGVRIRTIERAVAEIRLDDPETDLTVNALRSMVADGIIPSYKTGNKTLVNVNDIDIEAERRVDN